MSADTPVAKPHLDEGCRILTISASIAGSRAFIERLQALGTPPPAETAAPAIGGPDTATAHPDTGPVVTPYAMANRYYSAEVHFAAYALQAVFPGLFSLDRGPDYRPPPAVIFVWSEGEPYAKLVEELAGVMAAAGYEPEVCLAVRIPRTAQENAAAGDEAEEENTDIDTTLMSFGFEYVDGTRDAVPRADTEEDDVDNDIPRLPRVLDALSTIMWPSMQAAKSAVAPARPAAPRSPASNARRAWERDSIMEELLAVSGISGISRSDARHVPAAAAAARGPGAAGEDEDDEDEEIDALFAPYDFTSNAARATRPAVAIPHVTGGDGSARLVASPLDVNVDVGATSPFGLGRGAALPGHPAREVSIGFEDDFTVFVSAPADADADAEREESAPGGARGKTPWAALDLSRAGFRAGGGEGETTPLATALADSVVTGDSLGARSGAGAGLTPASARGTGRGRGVYRSLGSVSDFGGDASEAEEGAEGHAYAALAGGGHTDDDEDYGASEWEDGAEDEHGHDASWEEHAREGEWDDALDDEAERSVDVFGLGEEEDEEEGMPTRAEILATAARIFGGVPPGAPSGFRSAAEVQREAEARGRAAPVDGDEEEEDDTLGPRNMDIERVLHALQGLRTEIAGVDDEEERRRMAARVALGFVYGIDLEKTAGAGAEQ